MLKQWFSERDNTTFCVARTMIFAAGCSATYNFIVTQSHDYQGFCIGICALGAAIAVKNASEK